MIALMLAAALCNAEVCPGYGDNLVVENDKFGVFMYGPKEYHRWSGIDVFNKSNPQASCAGWLNLSAAVEPR